MHSYDTINAFVLIASGWVQIKQSLRQIYMDFVAKDMNKNTVNKRLIAAKEKDHQGEIVNLITPFIEKYFTIL